MLILASASPRRRELLARAGVPFEVEAADVDETIREDEPPAGYAERVARDKAHAVVARHPGAWVLAADTIVVADGEVLGKPDTPRDASAMLRKLVGRTHVVTTAVYLCGPGGNRAFAVSTEVDMRPLGDEEIAAYVASGEWRGKAGAYAAQGIAAAFITAIRGSYTNVVGLPLAEALAELAAAGAASARLDQGAPA